MATLTENVKRVTDALNDIETSIKNKGQTPTGKCETYAAAIDKIQTGTDVSDTTATAYDVVSGKKFYNSYGHKTEGLMAEHLNENFTPVIYEDGELPPEYELEDGYYGNCKIEPVKYQFPSASNIRYGNQIKLNDEVLVTGTYIETYSATTAQPSDVLEGKKFVNKFGSLVTGTLTTEPFDKTYTPRNAAYNYFDRPTNIISTITATIEGAKISDASHLLEGDALVTVDNDGNVTSTITEGTMTNNGAITKTLTSGEEYTIPEGYHNGLGKIIAPSGGGGLVASDVFTIDVANGNTVTGLSFRPKTIIVTSVPSATTTLNYTSSYIWNEGFYVEYMGSNSGTRNNKDARFPSVTNTGFTFKAPTGYGNRAAIWWAIG